LRITGPQGRRREFRRQQEDRKGAVPRLANHRGAEGNGRKATVRSSAKSGLEKLWHRLRANQRHVCRSAGKARPGGHAFTGYVRREESLEKANIKESSNMR
jgi:hypothetical protein